MKNNKYKRKIKKEEMLNMLLDGYSYREIGYKSGVSRQRVQQLLAPPREVKELVLKKFKDVKVPDFDDISNYNELEVCEYNRGIIEWADEVHIIWDNRSPGCIFAGWFH